MFFRFLGICGGAYVCMYVRTYASSSHLARRPNNGLEIEHFSKRCVSISLPVEPRCYICHRQVVQQRRVIAQTHQTSTTDSLLSVRRTPPPVFSIPRARKIPVSQSRTKAFFFPICSTRISLQYPLWLVSPRSKVLEPTGESRNYVFFAGRLLSYVGR